MEECGMMVVEIAKSNGAWDFLNDVEYLIIPKDLEVEFDKNPNARKYYELFPKSSKRSILEWIKNAKQETTRHTRILEIVSKASQNIKANHPKGKDAGPKFQGDL